MVMKSSQFSLRGIYDRAANIRAHWTPVERERRTGLPPDLPLPLRRFFYGSSSELQPAFNVCGRGSKQTPKRGT